MYGSLAISMHFYGFINYPSPKLQGLKKGASCVQKANRNSHLANCKLNKG